MLRFSPNIILTAAALMVCQLLTSAAVASVQSTTDVCAAVRCLPGYQCVPEPKQCLTTPCPQHRCVPIPVLPINPCAGNPCPVGQHCVPEPKICKTTPCPQFRCYWPPVADACARNPCPVGQRCVPEPKQCLTAPCPQYRCQDPLPGCGPNEEWSACGSDCPLTCDGPTMCTMQCVPGCKCQDGYVRDSQLHCIPATECTEKTA